MPFHWGDNLLKIIVLIFAASILCFLAVNECATGAHACDTESGAICHDLDNGYVCKCPSVGYQPLKNNWDPCIGRHI